MFVWRRFAIAAPVQMFFCASTPIQSRAVSTRRLLMHGSHDYMRVAEPRTSFDGRVMGCVAPCPPKTRNTLLCSKPAPAHLRRPLFRSWDGACTPACAAVFFLGAIRHRTSTYACARCICLWGRGCAEPTGEMCARLLRLSPRGVPAQARAVDSSLSQHALRYRCVFGSGIQGP